MVRVELGREVDDRTRPEDAADHGRALQHRPLHRRQAVDARGDQRLERVRDALTAAILLDERADRLLDEERIALALREYARDVDDHLALGEERHHELHALLRGQRLELDRGRAEAAAAPRRPYVQELAAGEAEEEERRVLDPRGQ